MCVLPCLAVELVRLLWLTTVLSKQEGNHALDQTCIISGPQETPPSHAFISAYGCVPLQCHINDDTDMADESGPNIDHSQADFYMPCAMGPGLMLGASMIPWPCGPEQCGMVHASGPLPGMHNPMAQGSVPSVANKVETLAAVDVSGRTHNTPGVGAFLPEQVAKFAGTLAADLKCAVVLADSSAMTAPVCMSHAASLPLYTLDGPPGSHVQPLMRAAPVNVQQCDNTRKKHLKVL